MLYDHSHPICHKNKEDIVRGGEVRLRWNQILTKCNLEDGDGERMKANGTVCYIQIQQRPIAFGRRTLPLSRIAVVEYDRCVFVGFHFERTKLSETSVVGQSSISKP